MFAGWLLGLLIASPVAAVTVAPELIYRTNADNTITISGYTGSDSVVEIPSRIEDREVSAIGFVAFSSHPTLVSVTVPAGVTRIGFGAFAFSTNLTAIYFRGNAPSLDLHVFDDDELLTIYYLAGTTGWDETYGGRPTALWTPPLPAPTGLSASDGTYTGKVHLTWNTVTGATHYLVFRSLTNNSNLATSLVATAGTDYDDMGATNWPGVALYYWVKAAHTQSSSPFSVPEQGHCAAPPSSRSADLAANGFLFQPAAIATGAHPESVSFTLSNGGPDDLMNDVVSYDFYLARATALDIPTAAWIGGLNDTLRLEAGGSVSIALQEADLACLAIPPDASGSYYVFVRARAAAVEDPDPSNNVARRTGTITIGADTPDAPVSGDFDGDGKADPALYRESEGLWFFRLSAGDYAAATAALGGAGQQPIAADFDGDGLADPGVYEAASGNWTLMLSGSGHTMARLEGFGGADWVPLAGDFDGDGQADPAIYAESGGAWRIKLSGSGYAEASLADFGGVGCGALALDFDGDGKADPGICLPVTGEWTVKLSGSGYTPAAVKGFGAAGGLLVPGRYDSDIRADAAIYNPANGNWTVLLSASAYLTGTLWGFGGEGCAPAVGDFDGDGRADPAVYQELASAWFIKLSGSGYATVQVQ